MKNAFLNLIKYSFSKKENIILHEKVDFIIYLDKKWKYVC